MKGLQIAVLLLVLSVSVLAELKCNSCVTQNGVCDAQPEDCEDHHDVCGHATFTNGDSTSVEMGCMTNEEVSTLSGTDNVEVKTCNSNLCL